MWNFSSGIVEINFLAIIIKCEKRSCGCSPDNPCTLGCCTLGCIHEYPCKLGCTLECTYDWFNIACHRGNPNYLPPTK